VKNINCFNKMLAFMVVVLLLGVGGLSGCSRASDVPPVNRAQEAGKAFPLTLTDDMGRQVTLNAEPVRIVSLAPSNTEILFALGLGSKVVGNTTYCDYPEEAKQVAKVGGFEDPNLEKVVVLKPDLVLATDMHLPLLKVMEDAGLKVVVLNPKTLEGIFANIELVGKAGGAEAKAVALTGELHDRLNAVTSKVASIPEKERPLVYYELWYEPYMSIGKDSLIGQLISLAGGINVIADSAEEYPKISEEVIIERNPAVMINSYGHGSGVTMTPQEIASRPGWSQLAFVKNSRIYSIESDLVALSGPRIVDGLEKMAQALYPSLFK